MTIVVVVLLLAAGCGDHPAPTGAGRASASNTLVLEIEGSGSDDGVTTVPGDLPDPEPDDTVAPDAVATPPTTPAAKVDPSTPRRSGPYAWLNDSTPSDTYTVAMVRGLSAGEVLQALGVVRRDVGPMTGAQVATFQADHVDARTYESPPIVQVDDLAGGVLVYAPYGFRPFERLKEMSVRGVAAAFTTTVELDTTVQVARRGRVVRQFDPMFYDAQERRGALPEERGLGLGGDDFGPAWSLLDRLTAMHVDRAWFYGRAHPTYVLTGT